VIEDDLRRLSFFAPAQDIRGRILAAVLRARRDRLAGRLIAWGACASLLLAAVAPSMVDEDGNLDPKGPAEAEAALLTALQMIPEESPFLHRLLTPPTSTEEEIARWVR